VYYKIRGKTKDALMRLIEREREGELVDRALIKNILGIFIEVGWRWRQAHLHLCIPAEGNKI